MTRPPPAFSARVEEALRLAREIALSEQERWCAAMLRSGREILEARVEETLALGGLDALLEVLATDDEVAALLGRLAAVRRQKARISGSKAPEPLESYVRLAGRLHRVVSWSRCRGVVHAWTSDADPRRVWPLRYVLECEEVPPGWGIAWKDPAIRVAFCAPVPLNWVIWTARRAWLVLRFGRRP